MTKKNNKKKDYQRPILKAIHFKDINLRASMLVDWRGFDQWTSGDECG